MKNQELATATRDETSSMGAPPERRAYTAPVLREYGDLRTLTLGPSPGLGESGNPAIFRS